MNSPSVPTLSHLCMSRIVEDESLWAQFEEHQASLQQDVISRCGEIALDLDISSETGLSRRVTRLGLCEVGKDYPRPSWDPSR